MYKNIYDSFFAAAFFFGLDGLLLPKEPFDILPFFVFLSPLPIRFILLRNITNKGHENHSLYQLLENKCIRVLRSTLYQP